MAYTATPVYAAVDKSSKKKNSFPAKKDEAVYAAVEKSNKKKNRSPAQQDEAYYAAVDKSKKKNRSPAQQDEAESVNTPTYEPIETHKGAPPVPGKNEVFESEHSTVTLHNMHSTQDIPPIAAAQANFRTQRLSNGTPERISKQQSPNSGTNCKIFVAIFITIAVVAIVLLICIAVLFAQVAKLRQVATLQQISAMPDESTDQLNRTFEVRFMELSQTISLLQNKTDNPGQFETLPVTSCTALPPSSPSGYYWVRASNGSAVRVYCDMTLSCGGVTGGWMRVTELDFNNTNIMCPINLNLTRQMNTRTCHIASSGAGCASVWFSTSGVTYNQVYGKVLAYQVKTTDAFGGERTGFTIDDNYVDGVSLTHGSGPRQHVWTFAAAQSNTLCECSPTEGRPSPAFVGRDYFCDSGTTSPLWDGAGCRPRSTCYTFNYPPWFHKQLPSPTSDDIEMRVCRDQGRSDEDIAISSVQIYIR